MSTVDVLALLAVAAGLVTWLLATTRLQHPLAGVPAMLDLWTAAGLLRLSGSPTWSRIAAAAALIAVRKLVTSGFQRRPPGNSTRKIASRSGHTSSTPSAPNAMLYSSS